MASDSGGYIAKVGSTEEEPQSPPYKFRFSVYGDWVNCGEAHWSGEWHNAFASLGPVARACLSPPVPEEWHPPTYDSYGGGGTMDAWHEALLRGDLDEVQALFTEPRDLLHWVVDGVEGAHKSTLHIAFGKGDVAILRHLFRISPNHFMQMLTMSSSVWCGGGLVTPLKEALQGKHHEVVRWMCDYGIMTDEVFARCGTPCDDESDEAPIQSALEIATHLFREEQSDAKFSAGDFLWTSLGIDYLLEQCILREPGITKHTKESEMREGETNSWMFHGAVDGSEVTPEQKGFLTGAFQVLLRKAYISTSSELQWEKGETAEVLEQWHELSEAGRKRRTESCFEDVIWPVKKIVSVSLSGPTEISCSQVLSGCVLAKINYEVQETRVPELMDKIAVALGVSEYSLSVVLPCGQNVDACSTTALLSEILS